ncbi:beta-glucosidase BglX [Tetragenococcus koreensis]|uniref:beta-glucosidase BglX n=1 Tax=Tetragenococcus koreensis TaxID=290335 RepID=UPI001F358CBE|nr:beta-glucosidase BglX [Tetragenococcus koreensis]MDN6640325.1 beta-glucosidase BglX [Tetragenococcus sp.]MDN6729795.1 beta-glucosidase BglX [Alkalibacterium sp.]MDN6836358.1 beta-glucosidase BglX [Lactococcus lactis]MCF1586201.1 beta-glucosidase BglX [Tetragenococcus koreensis]MCF1615787.1 beta-glucosidase BglX [Tetragenococcus koreensis]
MQKVQLKELLEEMTIDEKIDQLLQLSADFYSEKAEERTGPMADLAIEQANIDQAGTILGVSGAQEAIRIQKEYMAKHRLHIPAILMADIIHGFRTIFPIPLAIGSSWDESLVKQMAEISAQEAAVSGLHVTFSPMVDLVRDPRWGRVMESTGEDSYLNARLARAMVKGYQGNDLKNDFTRVASCVKHFAAYGAPIAGRDYNTVNMSERQLRGKYLTGYQEAINAGAKLVMTSFNTVDGMPATGNKWLINKLLRKEFGFSGVVISDFGSVKELVAHGVAENEKEAAQLALSAGVDIEMMTSCYAHALKELISEEKITEANLNEAVWRVLVLKNDLGLFEHPYRGADVAQEKMLVLSEEHRQKARETAQKTIVLLKNQEKVLPLSKEETIAILGPGTTSQDILGSWSWQGQKKEAISLHTGAKQYTNNLLYANEIYDYFEPTQKAFDEAIELAKKADKVVLALGETDWMSGEAASRSDIRLPQSQRILFDEIRKVANKVVVTLYNGRPLDLSVLDSADAIVEAWFPGTEGGQALADILWGAVNPSGRLSMSFPASVGQVPIYYDVDSTGRPYEVSPQEKYVSKYLDESVYAKYPFGFGLSYSSVEYNGLKLDKQTLEVGEVLQVTVTLNNLSEKATRETVQLYIRDVVGEVVRPIKELKAFHQVEIAAGKSKEVQFEIDESMLRYIHRDQTSRSDEGLFECLVGPNSRDLLQKEFYLNK